VSYLQAEHGLSERSACLLTGQPRSTQRYRTVEPVEEERSVRQQIRELAAEHPRYGYRRITALLRAEGRVINLKRVRRLWRAEGLQVLGGRRKRRRLGQGANSCVRRRAERRGHVWSMDFIQDATADGRRFRLLGVVDEWTRECVCLDARRSWVSGEVRASLAAAMQAYGVPEHVRCDNGTEYTAAIVREALAEMGVETLYIEPASPWQNGYGESFFARLRDELLSLEVFGTLREARVLSESWRREYNQERPHSSLGYLAPAVFAERGV
jgi:transposase InsO family protein